MPAEESHSKEAFQKAAHQSHSLQSFLQSLPQKRTCGASHLRKLVTPRAPATVLPGILLPPVIPVLQPQLVLKLRRPLVGVTGAIHWGRPLRPVVLKLAECAPHRAVHSVLELGVSVDLEGLEQRIDLARDYVGLENRQ